MTFECEIFFNFKKFSNFQRLRSTIFSKMSNGKMWPMEIRKNLNSLYRKRKSLKEIWIQLYYFHNWGIQSVQVTQKVSSEFIILEWIQNKSNYHLQNFIMWENKTGINFNIHWRMQQPNCLARSTYGGRNVIWMLD